MELFFHKKQVIAVNFGDGEDNLADAYHSESPLKIEPVEYEDDLTMEVITNGDVASSDSSLSNDDSTLPEANKSLLVNSGNRSSSETSSGLSLGREDSLGMIGYDAGQSRNDKKIDCLNGQVGEDTISLISPQTSHAESGYCSKYLSRHVIQDETSNYSSSFANCVDGGYILKTCR